MQAMLILAIILKEYLKEQILKNSNYLDAVRLYVQGKNLMTFTDYSGFDPEMSGGVLDTGIDRGNYPSPRTISVGLNVKF